MGDVVDLGAQATASGSLKEGGGVENIPQAIALGKYHVKSYADVAEVLNVVLGHFLAEDQANAIANLADLRVRPITALVANALEDLEALSVERI